MKILISTRRARTDIEEAWARAAMQRCQAKHGPDSALFDWDVDWARPDGEKEKFNAAVSRVIPSFDIVVLIEEQNQPGLFALGRGQSKCVDVALAHGRKVFAYRDGAFVSVKGVRIANAKTWKEAYATAVV